MKAIKINKISAVSIKKYLKMEGVKVLRCAQNGNGVLITIVNEVSNIDLALNFFNDYELTRINGEKTIKGTSITEKFIDFGTLYNVTFN